MLFRVEVFKNIDRLQKFLGLRVSYVLHVLAEACKIGSFNLLCGKDGVADPKAKESVVMTLQHLMSAHTASQAKHEVPVTQEGGASGLLGLQLLFFDLAQSTHSWTKAWHDVLTTPAAHVQETLFKQVPALKNVDFAHGAGDSSRPYLPCLPCAVSETCEEDVLDQGQEGTGQGNGKGNRKSDDKGDTSKRPVLSIDSIHKFMDGPDEVGLLDESVDAFVMGLEKLDTGFLQLLQARLQFAVWAAYGKFLRSNQAARSMEVDLSKKGCDAVLVSKKAATEEDFAMMFAGNVSIYAHGQLGKDHVPLCTLFGITFYCNAPKDLGSSDVMVPAWAAKPVSRNDLAYFHVESTSCKFILYFSGGDAGVHLQPSGEVSERFRQAMCIWSALSSVSDEEKKAKIAEYERFLGAGVEVRGER